MSKMPDILLLNLRRPYFWIVIVFANIYSDGFIAFIHK